MTLDDLERLNRGFYGFFWQFLAARHFSRVNCAETNRDRHRQAVYEIFSIERRFRWSKSRFSRFKETCARGHQRWYPRQSRYFTVVGQSFVKTAGDRLTVCEQELL